MLFNGNLSEQTAKANNLILQFFAEELTKDNLIGDFDYKISKFYISSLKQANQIVFPQYESSKFDRIDYPSVAMKYKGNNQAIFIESADTKLEFINAIQLICTNLDFNKGDFLPGILYEAESITDGLIAWKKEIYTTN